MKTLTNRITNNLTLNYIEDSVIKDDKITVVMCSFSFHNEWGMAYISTKEKPYKLLMFETHNCDIHENFNDIIEDNLEEISKRIDDFIKEWETDVDFICDRCGITYNESEIHDRSGYYYCNTCVNIIDKEE